MMKSLMIIATFLCGMVQASPIHILCNGHAFPPLFGFTARTPMDDMAFDLDYAANTITWLSKSYSISSKTDTYIIATLNDGKDGQISMSRLTGDIVVFAGFTAGGGIGRALWTSEKCHIAKQLY